MADEWGRDQLAALPQTAVDCSLIKAVRDPLQATAIGAAERQGAAARALPALSSPQARAARFSPGEASLL